MLTALLAFSICSGAYSLYRLFNDKQGAIDDCIGDSDSKLQKTACEKGAGLMRGIMVGLFIVVWLIQICEWSFQSLCPSQTLIRFRGLLHRE